MSDDGLLTLLVALPAGSLTEREAAFMLVSVDVDVVVPISELREQPARAAAANSSAIVFFIF